MPNAQNAPVYWLQRILDVYFKSVGCNADPETHGRSTAEVERFEAKNLFLAPMLIEKGVDNHLLRNHYIFVGHSSYVARCVWLSTRGKKKKT